MKVTKGVFIGASLGFGLSFCIAFIFMLFGQMAGGGVTSLMGESWMYFAVIIPFIVTFMILGAYFAKRDTVSNKKLWLISLLSAFFVTLYSGTIGAMFGEWVVRGGSFITPLEGGGYTSFNFDGIWFWGFVYAFVLLPLTTPVARLLIQGFLELLKKMKLNK